MKSPYSKELADCLCACRFGNPSVRRLAQDCDSFGTLVFLLE
ncbi:hypothetical protein [Caproicibacterium amylolyticum]|nr:hypothetical protein [Caproicibacterium amylolyticum]